MEEVSTSTEIRYQKIEQMGAVYHANYLVWFEIVRTKFIEKLGFQIAEVEECGVVSPVVDAKISFKKPIRYGDKATVETWLENYNVLCTIYGYHINKVTQEVAVSDTTEHVIVKKDSLRPLSLRKVFSDWNQAYIKVLNGEF